MATDLQIFSVPAIPEVTPPRLSYLNGEVSFWRAGADDWAPATLNTPLAPGDILYAGPNGNVEIQVGPRAFVRAGFLEPERGPRRLRSDSHHRPHRHHAGRSGRTAF